MLSKVNVRQQARFGLVRIFLFVLTSINARGFVPIAVSSSILFESIPPGYAKLAALIYKEKTTLSFENSAL